MLSISESGRLYNVEMDVIKKPFIGKTKQLIDRISSLDEKWYVEFWMVRYYFFGIEVHSFKKEMVKHRPGKSRSASAVG
ncbi:MAG: hypothetical protein H6536_06435 [Bacteroidales bacterium]|nr:hypothetical protein [Bacteroidales bacterium]